MAPDLAGDLVRRARAGDTTAWPDLVERYTGMVWAIVRGYRLADGDAADAVQTTWLRLVEHLDRIMEPDRVGTWLATTARNEALRLRRIAGRHVLVEDVDIDVMGTPVPVEIDSALLREERDTAVARALTGLSERCQALLRVLSADPPPSYDEVSAALAMPVGSIGPTRARCLGKLREALAPAGAAGLFEEKELGDVERR
ncbi:MAG TPA: sigma-70 family RNA polymerase sigma factor [Candidatus Dormibacteraeota bacterium]|nr:sigma-70 family RNA polymerase sigma factor [Candidatus Dormibacteraeota bacterium]